MKKFLLAFSTAVVATVAIYYFLQLKKFLIETGAISFGHRIDHASSVPAAKPTPVIAPATVIPPLPMDAYSRQKREFNRDGFLSLTRDTLKQLSTLTADHSTSTGIVETRKKLVAVAVYLERNNDLASDAFAFYEQCSGNSGLPEGVRAYCYSSYKKISLYTKIAEKPNLVSARVRDLAKRHVWF